MAPKSMLKPAIPIKTLPFINYIYSAFAIDFLAIIFILIVQHRLPLQIPLLYGLPQGEAQLTGPLGLFIPTGFSLIFIAINFFLAGFTKDDFLRKVLAVTSLAVAVFAAITSVKIAFLVGQL